MTNQNDPINLGKVYYNEEGEIVAFEQHAVIEGINKGLSKREYIAGLALQGLLSHSGSYGVGIGSSSVAIRAVEAADKLIEELNK